MSEKSGKYTTIHYQQYLELDRILNAQHPRSAELEKPAHEELLFIIVHQVYELWFKQIIHELDSVLDLFADEQVMEENLGVAVGRLERVQKILKLVVEQISIMESMTPLDFLDFRGYLFPASGFQSFQFRAIESLLGLPDEARLTYHGHRYDSVFPADQQAQLDRIYQRGTILQKVNTWLERTPFLRLDGFDFLPMYRRAVADMLAQEKAAINASAYLSEKEKEMRSQMVGGTDTYFQAILNPDTHRELVREGKKRLSYEATLAALFINLYRDEPMLHLPFRFMTSLIDIDNEMTNWRYRHAQMVLRMIGNKIGTGGSSGHDYLTATALKHQVFTDFHNISTLLIPRSSLPELPLEIKAQLNFYFNQASQRK